MTERTSTGGGVRGLPEAVARYVSARETLFASAAPSAAIAEELARLTDDALRSLAEDVAAQAPGRWSLVALGGYGAGRLLPASDIDLLLLVDGKPTSFKPFVERLLYPLWDAGLTVGHQVRVRKDHVRQCRDDLDTLTATLRGRAIAGDAGSGQKLLAEVAADARKRARKLVPALAARERPGSPYLLEPDLKEGAGGQRDADELAWLAAVLTGVPQRDAGALVGLGLLSAKEAACLARGTDALAAGRWALHLATPRATAHLTLDLAEELPIDVQALQGALADVHNLLLAVRARAAGRPPSEVPPDAPAVFGATERGDLVALERWAWRGELEALLPGFRELLTLRRPGLAHRFTVGDHCLRAACLAAQRPKDGLGADLFASLQDLRPLIAAALVHDAGKRSTEPEHAARGAEQAPGYARALGLDEPQAQAVSALVRHHLLLAETAATADIEDEEVVLNAAARLGDRSLVAPLYLLTVADSRATGAGTWSAWHAALVGDLAARLDAALSTDVEGAGLLARAEATREAAIAPVSADSPLVAVLQRMPTRYLGRHSAEEARRHADLALKLLDSGARDAFELLVSPGPVEATWRITVIALDRAGLFADIAGVLALSGLDILSAEAYAGPRGIALDVFTVRSATLATPDTSTWTAVERYLRSALGAGLDLRTRLTERRRHYTERSAGPIRVDVDVSTPYTTAIGVAGPDRVGLLHDVARAITESGLDIRWANAFGQDGRVRDTFHVTDDEGRPPRDPGELGHVAMRIRERME